MRRRHRSRRDWQKTLSAVADLMSAGVQEWPYGEQRAGPEQFMTFSLAEVLRSEHLLVFPEVRYRGPNRCHLDLLAFDKDEAVGVEAKMFAKPNRAKKALALARDAKRLRSFQPDGYRQFRRRLTQVLLACTWDREIAVWWVKHPGVGPKTIQSRHAGWRQLSGVLSSFGGITSLLVWEGLGDDGRNQTMYLLAAWREA